MFCLSYLNWYEHFCHVYRAWILYLGLLYNALRKISLNIMLPGCPSVIFCCKPYIFSTQWHKRLIYCFLQPSGIDICTQPGAQGGVELPRRYFKFKICLYIVAIAVVQLLSHIQIFVSPWTVAYQASLSSTVSQSLLKIISVKLVMLFNNLILCCPLLLLSSIFPSIRVFSNELALHIRWQSIGASLSATIFPMNNQGWFPIRLPSLTSLQPKRLSWIFSNTTIGKL